MACNLTGTPNQIEALNQLLAEIGPEAFAGSTVLKRHRLGNYLGAERAFVTTAKWGQARRRQDMARLYRGDTA
jgi:GH24 family phage-related lysozyme (muramidase)